MLIPLAGYAPDVDPYQPGVLVDCANWIPSIKGMKAAPSAQAGSYGSVGAAVTGAALCQKLDGSFRSFAGTAEKLWEAVGGAWIDVSRGSSYLAGEARWHFEVFGNTALAANKSCPLQFSNVGAFADIVAPRANCIAVTRGFVMLADCDDTGTGIGTAFGDQPNRWWCSPIFDATGSWVPSIATQANTGLLVDYPGPIRAVKALGENFIAYQDKGMMIGRYVGPPTVWQWQGIAGGIGCLSPDGVVSNGRAHFFIGFDDFYMYDGTRPVGIGGPIREAFFNALDKRGAYKIQALHDQLNGTVTWYYPSNSGNPNSICDSAVVYNYRSNRWGVADLSVEAVSEYVNGGITYDNLGSLYSTYDDLPNISYDSPFWVADNPVQAVFQLDHRPYTLTGTPGVWSFRWGTLGDDQEVITVTRVNPRWQIRPASCNLTPYWTMNEGGMLTQGPVVPMGSRGRFDYQRAARWHSIMLEGSGPCEISAINFEGVPSGEE